MGERHLYDQVGMARNILEMIGMIRHVFVSESRNVLRTMLAGALADDAPTRVEAA